MARHSRSPLNRETNSPKPINTTPLTQSSRVIIGLVQVLSRTVLPFTLMSNLETNQTWAEINTFTSLGVRPNQNVAHYQAGLDVETCRGRPFASSLA
jgi:hypothetical protein